MKIYSGISKEIAAFVINYTNMLVQARCDCWGCVKASHEMDDKNELLKKKNHHDPELDNTFAFPTDPPKVEVHNAALQTVQTMLLFTSLNAFT